MTHDTTKFHFRVAVLDALHQKIKSVVKDFEIEKVYLFGSYARQQYHANSDIDLLLELSPQHQIGLMALADLKYRLEDLTGKPIDLVVDGGISKHIKPFIEREKILMYEKNLGG